MSEPRLAHITFINDGDPTRGVLEISTCRLGCYLTAGRGRVRIPVNDGPEFRNAFGALLSGPRDEAAEVVLGRELWIIDSSLRADVAGALSLMMRAIDISQEDLARCAPDRKPMARDWPRD